MIKKSISLLLHSIALAGLAASFAADALQTVQPVNAAGTAFPGSTGLWTTSVPVGTVVTVIGRYSTNNTNESGLGLKVKYDETKFTAGTVTVTALNTKCMIAPPQIQSAGAASQAVLGWIDTAIRTPAGAVDWPYAADPATPNGCLNPNTPANDVTATAAGAVNLFRFQGTLAPSVAPASTTDVTITADGNVSYAGPATPGMADQVVRITAAAPPLCNLDMDGDGSVTSARDGELLRRAMNPGIPDANVTLGIAFGAGSTRITGADIRTYLNSFAAGSGSTVLDVDASSTSTSPVDGIAIKRALNPGIPSANITIGLAVTAGTTGSSIRTYLNNNCGTSLTP